MLLDGLTGGYRIVFSRFRGHVDEEIVVRAVVGVAVIRVDGLLREVGRQNKVLVDASRRRDDARLVRADVRDVRHTGPAVPLSESRT